MRQMALVYLETEEMLLSTTAKETFRSLLEEFEWLEGRIDAFDEKIKAIAAASADAKRLQTIPGIGPMTATALLAAISDVRVFKNGRQLAAWLGLVPRQNSSGGKTVLSGITKRGDVYLRSLLVHGGRSVLRTLRPENLNPFNQWAIQKKLTRGYNRAAVAIANKNARIVWAVLTNKTNYQSREQMPA
jgi:transposase